jgi:hypothetical protein
LRIKEQETRLTLLVHDDDDELQEIYHACCIFILPQQWRRVVIIMLTANSDKQRWLWVVVCFIQAYLHGLVATALDREDKNVESG